MGRLACNCGKFVIGTENYPDPNNYFFDKETHYIEMIEKSLLRIKNFIPSQPIPDLFGTIARRLRGASFSRQERFVRCPVCGRIHIFWPRGDGVTVVTYVPEVIEKYNVADASQST
jgi:hypothetical protein